MKKLFVCVLAIVAISSCGGSTSSGGSTSTEVLTGGERFGWDQQAADAGELATFAYALYVDGVRSLANDVSCASTPTGSRFPCTCRLPALAPGPHRLQIAAFITDAGVVRESDRSPAVSVIAR